MSNRFCHNRTPISVYVVNVFILFVLYVKNY